MDIDWEVIKNIKFVNIPVSAPFHCSLMKPAADRMKTFLQKTNFKNKILILGDMYELGDDEIKYHQEITDYCQSSNIEKIINIINTFVKIFVIKDILNLNIQRDNKDLPIKDAGVHIPPSFAEVFSASQIPLSAIIFEVDPYPGSLSPLIESLID